MSDNRHRTRDKSTSTSRHVMKLSEDGTHPTRYYSSKQEHAVAKAVGGQTTSNSGATMWQKGDVLTDQFLIECKTKTTKSSSISIKKEWLEKNTQEAAFMGKPYSAVVFSFGPDEENHYIINHELFEILINTLNNTENF